MKRIIFVFASMTVILMQSCRQSTSDNNMAFESVIFVESFPRSFQLGKPEEQYVDVIGVRNFAIQDSLLIFSTVNDDALWSFVSLNDGTVKGNFLKKGQGPLEFLQSPSVATRTTFIKQDSLYAYIYDSQRGALLKMNVNESLQSGIESIHIVDDSLSPFLFNLVVIDTAIFVAKEINADQTQQLRYLRHKKDKTLIENLYRLNDAKISPGEDINIMSTIAKRSSQKDIIVEMPIGLNHLNMYTLDGSFQKSICIGDKLSNIDGIQKRKRQNRLYTFADLRIFDDFFGVLYINEEELTYQTGRKKMPKILLFDWQATPLAEIMLDHHVTCFDIDFANENLYTFDAHSDAFFKHNLTDILKSL